MGKEPTFVSLSLFVFAVGIMLPNLRAVETVEKYVQSCAQRKHSE